MSLPSSQPLPEDISDLPPVRRRHIRRMPREATRGERNLLLDSLTQLTTPNFDYFLLLIIGALFAGSALVIDEPALLIVSVVILPFLSPIFAFSLLAVRFNLWTSLKSLLALSISAGTALGVGALAGLLTGSQTPIRIEIRRFAALDGLHLSILIASTAICCLVLLREDKLPRLSGVLISYELFLPFVVAGFGLASGNAQLTQGALLAGLFHIFLAIVVGILTFLFFGFIPTQIFGWVISALMLVLSLTFFILAGGISPREMKNPSILMDTPTPTQLEIQTNTPSEKSTESSSPTQTEWTPTKTILPTSTKTVTQPPTETPTPEPTTYWGVILVEEGALIRESPGFSAPVVTYANYNDLIEILGETTQVDGYLWYRVATSSGKEGWILAALFVTPTPTNTP